MVSAPEILSVLAQRFELDPVPADDPGAVATRYRHRDGRGEIGVISSVSKPFCGYCQRLRLSADGKLFACLFAALGTDLRPLLRGNEPADLGAFVRDLWAHRSDRYSELRGESARPKAEMSYLGG